MRKHRARASATVAATISILALLTLAMWQSVGALEPEPGPATSGGGNSIDVRYGSAPTIDGVIAPGEYGSPSQIQFVGYEGTVLVYVRHDASNLYVAFDLPDTTPYGGSGPAVQVFLDTNHDQDTTPRSDDYRLTIDKGGGQDEGVGNGVGWDPGSQIDWSGGRSVNATGWQAEFSIGFAKLGITPGTPKTFGFAVANVWTLSGDYYWPTGGDWDEPDTWGEAYSSEEWALWHFKEGGLVDYAVSGVPDFDQKQNGWHGPDKEWTYCGPVAAANSLWWFDSKFEPDPVPPPIVNDGYPLVEAYGAWDDHDVSNPTPLVDELADYFGTDPVTGTNVYSMYYGIQSYLYDHGLYDDYLVTLAESPTIDWVVDEVVRSEDVILLLGLYQEDSEVKWRRLGGHYVTVAGVDATPGDMSIAFSDPFLDNAEAGQPGRVLSGTLLSHYPPHPGSDPTVHNDAGNISYDYYSVAETNSPGGVWGPGDYPVAEVLANFLGQNPHPEIPTLDPGETEKYQAEVEFAIAVSPFTWKPGEWEDYAPSCLPDFDQKQDEWAGPEIGTWSHCGPVAVANSLWWFDSKFETQPLTPSETVVNDHYPLVQTHGSYDDHWTSNVVPLVDDLATYMGTDSLGAGTIITNMVTGTLQYLQNQELSLSYSVSQVHRPEWGWLVDEVTRCEDVVLLLGFWKFDGDGLWHRYGGHYVTVAGVDPVGDLVGLSDPFFDQAELGWPWLGRVFPVGTHQHPAEPPDAVHNDAGVLSHDVYSVVVSPSPGGKWGLEEYPAASALPNFEGLNGPGPDEAVPGPPPPDPSMFYTEIEWAMAVSPRLRTYIPLTMKLY
ncbi:MAG TPA: hypothetical protein VJ714_03360 [Anaerolineae bacterium]|nr:hypothetical protein [Anaerolineae bacterium]